MSETIERHVDLFGRFTVQLTDAPDDWMSRCFTDEWRNHFYNLKDESEVLEHLAYNAIVNGVEDISRLDGWADIEPGAVILRFRIGDIEVAQ